MDWTVVMERYGLKTESVGTEPFSPLSSYTAAVRSRGEAVTRITVSTGTSHDYGALKVNVSVSLECPQTEACINLAAESAFWKAVELANDCASHLGAPQIQAGNESNRKT